MSRVDVVSIVRVANGWVIEKDSSTVYGKYPSGGTCVSTTPDELAEQIRAWALAQVSAAEPRAAEPKRWQPHGQHLA